MQQKHFNILSVKKPDGFRSLELKEFNSYGITVIEWCSSSGGLTDNELIILLFCDCIITIITIIIIIIIISLCTAKGGNLHCHRSKTTRLRWTAPFSRC